MDIKKNFQNRMESEVLGYVVMFRDSESQSNSCGKRP